MIESYLDSVPQQKKEDGKKLQLLRLLRVLAVRLTCLPTLITKKNIVIIWKKSTSKKTIR